MNDKSIILVAEDDGEDVFMMQRAIGQMNALVTLHIAEDGEQMIDYLSGNEKYSDRTRFPLPALILLDIKMPRNNGFDVLEWLKKDGTLTHIPVVIVSASRVHTDLDKARELGALAYLVKPVDFDTFKELFASIEKFLATHPYEVQNADRNRGNTDFFRKSI